MNIINKISFSGLDWHDSFGATETMVMNKNFNIPEEKIYEIISTDIRNILLEFYYECENERSYYFKKNAPTVEQLCEMIKSGETFHIEEDDKGGFYASLSREDDTVKLDLSIQITDYYEYVIQRIPDQNVVYLPIESWYAPWKGAYTIDRCFSEASETYEEAEKFIKNMPEHSQEYAQRWGYGFGYRRRVQICDLSNVNTDWYQNQLKTVKAAKEKGIDLLDEKFFGITATQHYENITGEN